MAEQGKLGSRPDPETFQDNISFTCSTIKLSRSGTFGLSVDRWENHDGTSPRTRTPPSCLIGIVGIPASVGHPKPNPSGKWPWKVFCGPKLKQAPPRLRQRPGGPRGIGIGGPFPPDIHVVAQILTCHFFERRNSAILHRRISRLEGFGQYRHRLLITEVTNCPERVQPDIDVVITAIAVGEMPNGFGTTDLHPGVTGSHPHHHVGVIQATDTDCPGGIIIKFGGKTENSSPDPGVVLGKHAADKFPGEGSLRGGRGIPGFLGLLPQFLDSLVGCQAVPLLLDRDLLGILPRQGPGAATHEQPTEQDQPQRTVRPGPARLTSVNGCQKLGHSGNAFANRRHGMSGAGT